MDPSPATPPTNWLAWMAFINTAWLFLLSVFTWLRKPGEDAGKVAETLTKELGVLKERVEHLTTAEELAELEGTVKAIDERTKGLAEAITSIRASQSRIETYLLNQK